MKVLQRSAAGTLRKLSQVGGPGKALLQIMAGMVLLCSWHSGASALDRSLAKAWFLHKRERRGGAITFQIAGFADSARCGIYIL